MWDEITFYCKTTTPVLCTGASSDDVDFRLPSFNGILRFWWRVIRCDIATKYDINRLRQEEAKIFGSTENKSAIRLLPVNYYDEPQLKKYNPTPHNENQNPNSWGITFNKASFKVKWDNSKISRSELIALFKLSGILGGLGKRTRRGYGSFCIWTENEKLQNIDLPTINNLLNELCSNNDQLVYELNAVDDHNATSFIKNTLNPPMYNYIKGLEIIETETTDSVELLKKIGNATHMYKKKIHKHNSRDVISPLGFTKGNKRLSSPVCVSIIPSTTGGSQIIVTKLKTTIEVDEDFQDNFINELNNF